MPAACPTSFLRCSYVLTPTPNIAGNPTVANACGFEHVPVLEQNVVLTPELIKKYADDDIGFEGVVIHCKGNTFKVISKPYDSRK
jgi:hypothetical protein